MWIIRTNVTTDMLVLCYGIDLGWKFYSEKHLTKLKYPHTTIMFTRRVCCFKIYNVRPLDFTCKFPMVFFLCLLFASAAGQKIIL